MNSNQACNMVQGTSNLDLQAYILGNNKPGGSFTSRERQAILRIPPQRPRQQQLAQDPPQQECFSWQGSFEDR